MSKVKMRIAIYILCISLVFSLTVTSVSATTGAVEMEITINGELVVFEDAHPYINEDDRTMVPIRFISENLGAEVCWDGATQTVTVQKGENTITLQVDSDIITVNGESQQMDTRMTFNEEQGRNYVPLFFVSENLDSNLYWDMIDGVHFIDIEEHSWIEEFFDWEENFDLGSLLEPLDEEIAEQIANNILVDFQEALRNQDFTALDSMHSFYLEFIDEYGAMFFPDSAFDITFHDVVILESYGNYIVAEVEFDYLNYYRLNLRALNIYFAMLGDGIDPDEVSSQEIRDYVIANKYMKQLEEVEQQRYVRNLEIEKINEQWKINDFRIQTGYEWHDDLDIMAEQLTLEEIFEFAFLEMRAAFLFFGEFAGEFGADSGISVQEAMETFEAKLEEIKAEIAEHLGYDSFEELIKVEQSTEEFYRIIEQL
ncbi:copper amine oxidase N-terminal domain-containing protein [Desulfuribacillus alkaliarsenatis]|uniref:Copper amine oxidase-like N-terminal domain-containing protein n=1 Tax=Desulfuribacillus alkaliarsenatis TaxID=766136 RepID=A0A1E5G137_9FIRM|nr:copper amine oxidase N-terminal domain-containing protein [Desulfuribacillus alkaliarsenatis]OEF96627.1 hypothetical protein BHF68_08270 [Desulfuribacillus alkaliarsenatis]